MGPNTLAPDLQDSQAHRRAFLGPNRIYNAPISDHPAPNDVLAAFTAYAAMSAEKVTIPKHEGGELPSPPSRSRRGRGCRLRSHRYVDRISPPPDGIASATVAPVSRSKVDCPTPAPSTSDIEKIQMNEVDVNAVIVRARSGATTRTTKFRRVYRQVVTGRYDR